MKSYVEYRNYVEKIFSAPQKIVFDKLYDEYYYILGNDLLRVSKDGKFISLYPGANTDRVLNAIKAGGEL